VGRYGLLEFSGERGRHAPEAIGAPLGRDQPSGSSLHWAWMRGALALSLVVTKALTASSSWNMSKLRG
jgi:hypothetical protein